MFHKRLNQVGLVVDSVLSDLGQGGFLVGPLEVRHQRDLHLSALKKVLGVEGDQFVLVLELSDNV